MIMKNFMGLFVGVWITRDKTRLTKTFRDIGTLSLSFAMLGQTILLAGNSPMLPQERHGHARGTANESRDSGRKKTRGNLQHATANGTETQSQDVTTSTEVRGQSITPVSVSTVSFQQLAEMRPRRQTSKGTVLQAMPAPGTITDTEEAPPPPQPKTPQTPVDSGGPFIPSPPPSSPG